MSRILEVFTMMVSTDPVPKGRPRMTRSGRAYTPQRTRDAEAVIHDAAVDRMGDYGPFTGPVWVRLWINFKKPKSNKTQHHTQRPDLDNVGKLVTDAINGVVYLDDSQIVSLELVKDWGNEGLIRLEVGRMREVSK